MKEKQAEIVNFEDHLFAPCKGIQRGIGFRIPLAGFRTPTLWILDSNPLDSRFQPPGLRIPIICTSDSHHVDSKFQHPCF